jgi:methylglutaconyl-CoA hydratase
MTPTLQDRRQLHAPPFNGMTLRCKETLTPDALQKALTYVVAYLAEQFPDTPLEFFQCWLEHDSSLQEAQPTSWETLHSEVSSTSSLLRLFDHADFEVRRAFVAGGDAWLLRFFIDDDPNAIPRLGDFDLTISIEHAMNLYGMLQKPSHGEFDLTFPGVYFDLKEHGPRLLEVAGAGPIGRIQLNRPEVHNAFNAQLIAELTETILRLGSASWIEAMVGYSHDENLADARTLQTLFETVAQCPKVVVAAVNGAAMGGGAGLVAACDYAIASERATFAFSEVKLGIIPAVISPFVVEKIGLGAARAYFTTGRRFDAQTALRLGLVQEVVPEQDLEATVNSVLTDACSAGPKAIVAAKKLLRELGAGTADPVEAIAQIRVSPEGQEGIRAFLEKRKPVWKRDS